MYDGRPRLEYPRPGADLSRPGRFPLPDREAP